MAKTDEKFIPEGRYYECRYNNHELVVNADTMSFYLKDPTSSEEMWFLISVSDVMDAINLALPKYKDSVSKTFESILTERDYQDTVWDGTKSSGEKSNERGSLDRSIDEFSAYIAGYGNELLDVIRKSDDPKEKLDLIRKIAALCVACGEKHGLPKRETVKK